MGARLDQHFLENNSIRDAIIAAAELKPGQAVVEIGPGKGMLTRALLDLGCSVTAVEMDRRLAEILGKRFSSSSGFKIMAEDFLKLDLESLSGGPVTFVANLPYAVATPILQRILPWPRWGTAVLMFQKEVAERIVAQPGSADYGLLTLSVLLHAEAELVLQVSKDCFAPPPRVNSAVVRLRRRESPLDSQGESKFFKIARAAFGQRRKMAIGLIAQAMACSRESIGSILQDNGVSPAARAQDIPFPVYLKLRELVS